jgi:hypothetical protein
MRNSGEPQRSWATPARLPPDTVDNTAVIAAVESGIRFTLSGW